MKRFQYQGTAFICIATLHRCHEVNGYHLPPGLAHLGTNCNSPSSSSSYACTYTYAHTYTYTLSNSGSSTASSDSSMDSIDCLLKACIFDPSDAGGATEPSGNGDQPRPMTNAPGCSAATPSTTSKRVGQKRSATTSDQEQAATKRVKTVEWLATELPSTGTAEVRCVFISHYDPKDGPGKTGGTRAKCSHGPTPIPLWPQYKMQFRKVVDQDSTWLRLGNTEPWIVKMADAMTNLNVREIVAAFLHRLRLYLSHLDPSVYFRTCACAWGPGRGADGLRGSGGVATWPVRTHVRT